MSAVRIGGNTDADGQWYAVMFVNNNEYTLSPDDITIYTGGGQGDENYDNGGFPKFTLTNCIDLSYVRNPATNQYEYVWTYWRNFTKNY